MTPTYRKSLIAVVVILAQFFVFRQFYPFASFFQDSYGYIDGAAERLAVSYRPMGYSWFLIAIHAVSSSDTFLVFIQYVLLQLSGLYVWSTVHRLYRPHKRVSNVIFYCLLLNPLTLYMANTVSSDALFTSLTLLWLTELLKLMHSPEPGPLLRQIILLVLIFYIRFNALYYPLIAAIAFLLATRRRAFRFTAIIATILVVVICAKRMEHVNLKATGAKTWSSFGGWQMANNALYAYPFIKLDTSNLSPECKDLDRMVRQYFDTARPQYTWRQPDGTWYMWDPHSPLKKYLRIKQAQQHTDYFTAWSRVGPIYSQYGYHIVLHHPLAYAKAFSIHSAATYFYPPLEVLGHYNEEQDTVNDLAKNWFHYNSNKVTSADKRMQRKIVTPLRFCWLLFNIAGVITAVFFLTTARAKWRTLDKGLQKALLLTLTYCVVNAAFFIFATTSVFRYQLAPMTWLFIFTLLTYDHWLSRWNPAPAARKE